MCDRRSRQPVLILSTFPLTAHEEISKLAYRCPVLLTLRKMAVYHLLSPVFTTMARVRYALEFYQLKKRDVRVHHGPAHQTQEIMIDASKDNSRC